MKKIAFTKYLLRDYYIVFMSVTDVRVLYVKTDLTICIKHLDMNRILIRMNGIIVFYSSNKHIIDENKVS